MITTILAVIIILAVSAHLWWRLDRSDSRLAGEIQWQMLRLGTWLRSWRRTP